MSRISILLTIFCEHTALLIQVLFLEHGLILRQGGAGKRLSFDSSDFDRLLTISGKRELTDIAKSLKELGVQFNFVITNPLKRAHQTASSWPSQGEQNVELG